MTVAELLALLGRAWSRLLLYPGGLAALGALWLVGAALRRGVAAAQPAARAGGASVAERLSAVALPWLAIALLPLPYARAFDRPLDAVFALALLEWPRLLALAHSLRDEASADRAARRLAGLLNGAPPLVLALLALAQATGSLELGLIAAGPADGAPAWVWALFLAGAVALTLTLPALVEAGPFRVGAATGDRLLGLGLRLRALGLVLLAALPWLALLPAAGEDGAPALWLAPLPPLLIALALWGFDRATAGRRARPWAWACLGLSGALALALLAGSALALRDRLA